MDEDRATQHRAGQDRTLVRPNLFIVGAPKCGTTAWAKYLGSHPDIFFSALKEPHYFTTDAPRRRRVSEESQYLDLFEQGRGKRIIAEASTSYLYSTEAAANLKSFAPDAKFLIFVRNQEAFLPSWHNQLVKNGAQRILDFETAWGRSGQLDESELGFYRPDARLLDYKACGRFAEQIERFHGQFARTQILVLHARDWTRDPRSTYLGVLDFLDLEDDGRTEFPPANEAQRSRSEWLHRLLLAPPPAVRKGAQLLRRLTGRNSLGLGKALSSANLREGYVSTLSAALEQEIRDYYAADRAATERWIWHPTQQSGQALRS